MPITACEYCGKPINSVSVKLCAGCSREIEDAYVKARRYIYKNPKESDFISIIEATEISEKALSYLINKGRIMIADRPAGGQKCRACGKDTEGGAICQQCMAKIIKEKLTTKQEKKETEKTSDGSKRILPISHNYDD